MTQETIDEILHELADDIELPYGIYGEHVGRYPAGDCACRNCWTSRMKDRIREALWSIGSKAIAQAASVPSSGREAFLVFGQKANTFNSHIESVFLDETAANHYVQDKNSENDGRMYFLITKDVLA